MTIIALWTFPTARAGRRSLLKVKSTKSESISTSSLTTSKSKSSSSKKSVSGTTSAATVVETTATDDTGGVILPVEIDDPTVGAPQPAPVSSPTWVWGDGAEEPPKKPTKVVPIVPGLRIPLPNDSNRRKRLLKGSKASKSTKSSKANSSSSSDDSDQQQQSSGNNGLIIPGEDDSGGAATTPDESSPSTTEIASVGVDGTSPDSNDQVGTSATGSNSGGDVTGSSPDPNDQVGTSATGSNSGGSEEDPTTGLVSGAAPPAPPSVLSTTVTPPVPAPLGENTPQPWVGPIKKPPKGVPGLPGGDFFPTPGLVIPDSPSDSDSTTATTTTSSSVATIDSGNGDTPEAPDGGNEDSSASVGTITEIPEATVDDVVGTVSEGVLSTSASTAQSTNGIGTVSEEVGSSFATVREQIDDEATSPSLIVPVATDSFYGTESIQTGPPPPDEIAEREHDVQTACGISSVERSSSVTLFLESLFETVQTEALTWILESDLVCPENELSLTQRYILSVLFLTVGGNSWNVSTAWLTDSSECTWYGISCNTQEAITKLELSNNGLNGILSDELFYLTDLEGLTLDHNTNIRGSIPSSVGLLTKLKYLNLDDNSISGRLPSELYTLSNLEAIDMNDNALTGPLESAVNLTNLVIVQLQNNQLTGNIPADSFVGLEELVLLQLHQNNLTGTLDPICNEMPSRRLSKPSYLQFLSVDCSEIACPCCSVCV